MVAQLRLLQSKACQASAFLCKKGTASCKQGSAYFKQMMEQNKHFVQEPATVEKCNELSKQLFYTRLASIPKRKEAFWKELNYYAKGVCKPKEENHIEKVGIATLLGLECFAWFYAGKVIGRGFTLTGYDV
uniref:uncharacterized protein LOC122590499 n=1 Tax=Erigeron canadensis TaxID=72917 RepID=UPI001CB99BD5|nr:uncharacterized protein LOC122590499 [Erigeron canadensis]